MIETNTPTEYTHCNKQDDNTITRLYHQYDHTLPSSKTELGIMKFIISLYTFLVTRTL